MASPIQVEPSAELRQMANLYRQIYIALLNAGFNSTEALAILGTMIATALRTGSDGGQG